MMGTMTATTRYDHYISLKNINMNRFYFSDAFLSVSRPTGFQLVFVLLPVVFLTSQGSIQVSQHVISFESSSLLHCRLYFIVIYLLPVMIHG